MSVRRFDTSRLSKFKKTAQGFLKGPANLTRVGVFAYGRVDGSVQRELRLPEEVFNQDSLETLATAPLTDLHPDRFVDPGNVASLEIGSLHGDPKADGDFVAATVLVKAGQSIKDIETGDRAELSCGYTCDLEMKSGTWRGEKYDAIQRNIRYNHIALGPRGWGRAGSQVALRTDSSDALAEIGELAEFPVKQDQSMETVEIKIDGITVTVPKLAAELFNKELTRCDGLIKQLEGKLGAAEAEATSLKARVDSAADPKVLQARVDARVQLVTAASKVLGELDLSGLSDRDIQVKALCKADPAFKADGKSDEYVAGAFGTLRVQEDAAAKSRSDANEEAKETKEVTKKDAATARAEGIAKRNARTFAKETK